jgi:hypothetical protein
MTDSKGSIKLQTLMAGLMRSLRQAQEIENNAIAKGMANPADGFAYQAGLMIADAQFEIACEVVQPDEAELKKNEVPEVSVRLAGAAGIKAAEAVASKIKIRFVSNTISTDESAEK